MQMDWMDDASCRGMDGRLFFGDQLTIEQRQQVRDTCNGCPVLAPCREYGLHYERHGTWGGLTEREREQVRSARNIPTPGIIAIPRQRVTTREPRHDTKKHEPLGESVTEIYQKISDEYYARYQKSSDEYYARMESKLSREEQTHYNKINRSVS